MTADHQNQSFSIRTAALPVYLPSFLIAVGEGAIIPTLPATATALGANLAVAGLVAGLLMIAQVVGDLPSGWLVHRFGENRSMIGAAGVIAIGVGVCLLARELITLAVGVFMIGLATAIFGLARHALLTTYAPFEIRARALSTLGGTFRGGYFVGPFVAAAVIPLWGTQAVFWVNMVCCALTVVVLLALPDPTRLFAPNALAKQAVANVAHHNRGLFSTIWEHHHVLFTVGTGALLVGMLRASRQVILPLWAVHLDMDAAHTSLVIGVAGFVDFGLFYASGQIMDRFGRAWSAVPSMIGLGLGHAALVFTGDVWWFAAVAVLMSLANGVGSGILMTLGADLAPQDEPAPFLGAWRFMGDTGNALAPAAISGITAVLSLFTAGITMGVFGLIGAALLARYVPRLKSDGSR